MVDYIPIDHYNGQIIDQIQKNDIAGLTKYLDEINDTRYDFLIQEAIKVGSLELVKFFINRAVESVKDRMYRLRFRAKSALHRAIEYDQREIVKFFIYEKLVPVGKVCLIVACQYGRMQLFADLYSHLHSHYWELYLKSTIEVDQVEMLQWLFQFAKGLGIIISSNTHYLELARRHNSFKIVKMLTV